MNEGEVRNARSAIDYFSEYKILEDVSKDGDAYYMKVSIEIAGKSSEFIPVISHWYIEIPEDYHIKFLPANENGMIATFQHQEFNGEIPDKPFRSGYPCLHKPLHGIIQKYVVDGTPFEKFYKYAELMLSWLRDAANDNLVQAGHPYEVPTADFSEEFIFRGCDTELWGYFDYKCGFASVDKIYDKYILARFCDTKREEYNSRVYWGDIESKFERITDSAIWIKLKGFPIQQPWMYPQTWEDLFRICKAQGIDVLGQILNQLANSNFSQISFLLFVFPIPKNHGEAANTYYWLMCDLSSFGSLPNGFRRDNKGRCNYYKLKLRGRIKWFRPRSWDNVNLLARGAMQKEIQDRRIVMIGVGAIGSVVAEELSRMGARFLTIFDGDTFSDGNVARHTLSLAASGKNKSTAIKSKLSDNNPSIEIVNKGYLDEKNIDTIENADIIIDCSADSEVLNLLAQKRFEKKKDYFVAAVSYGAKDLVVYSARRYYVDKDLYNRVSAPHFNLRTESVTHDNMIMEGVGCYHPVFPARCDDIYLFASILVKYILSELSSGTVRERIVKYTISDDISVKRDILHEEKI